MSGHMKKLEQQVTLLQAGRAEADTVLRLLKAAADWMEAQGIRQWRTAQFTEEEVARYFDERLVYLARIAGEPAGMFTLQSGDELYWAERNDPRYAYLHRLAVAGPYRGAGLGTKLLELAASLAEERGCTGLRLDTAAHNVKLNRYYQSLGFRFQGIRDFGGGRMANLYELERDEDPDAILLRYFTEKDAEQLIAASVATPVQPDDAVSALPFPAGYQELQAYLKDANDTTKLDRLIYSAVHRRSGQVIGHLALTGIQRGGGSAEVTGLFVAPDSRGKGYGGRMLAEAIRTGLDALKLIQLRARISPLDFGTVRLFSGAGFKASGQPAAMGGTEQADEQGMLTEYNLHR
ncbi:GNAT family N-acetyltransferase [Paenibacillus sp. CN-4]|uniref:GNAT family N-acetyltransferase n=1 Tax=Paenibacillus nanchangensis TaxID=3348343 RepID=UPI0039784738